MTDTVITKRVIEIEWTEQLETNYVRRITETELRRILGDEGAERVIAGDTYPLMEHIERAGGAEAIGARDAFAADADGGVGWRLPWTPVAKWVDADAPLEKPELGHGTLRQYP